LCFGIIPHKRATQYSSKNSLIAFVPFGLTNKQRDGLFNAKDLLVYQISFLLFFTFIIQQHISLLSHFSSLKKMQAS
jgi:hypothetical protein